MVASSGLFTMDMLAIFRKFSEIKPRYNCHNEKSRYEYQEVKKELDKLSETIFLRGLTGDMILYEITKVMEYIDLWNDSRVFASFYHFVFFICRENNQKSISASMAVSAWKLLLQGRFPLLDCWCDFIMKELQYNVSEDNWQQILSFSSCMDENLQNYDALAGCWPILIDDFVEHVSRIKKSGASCSSNNNQHYSADSQKQQYVSSVPESAPIQRSKRRHDSEDHELSKRSRYFDENYF